MDSFVDNAVAANKVVMFSWVNCPYCARAKVILSAATRDIQIYNIDTMPEGDGISEVIYKRYKHDTVPAIFIKGKFVGGCSDLEELKQRGALSKMIA